jgi:hypothetical protein
MPSAAPPLLDSALDYAGRGYAVFPCHTPTDAGCSCRNTSCTNIGKHPRTMHGVSDATTDERKVRAWWQMWPEANIGIACGPSGLVVVDIDPRHGGDESWRDVVAAHPQVTATRAVVTPGGGEHYYYQSPPGERVGNVASSERFIGPFGVGVDVRGWGGYVIAPPSLHASGRRYEWQSDETIARLPLPLFEALRGGHGGDQPLISMADILAGVPEGERDWALFRAAAKLRYADVPYDMALELITRAAQSCTPPFSAAQARQKVDSAYRRYEPGQHAILAPTQHEAGLSGRVLLGDLMRRGIPEPEWLISNVLVRGYVHLLYGAPACGKTQIALSWAQALMAEGKSVLFIDEESGDAVIASRLQAFGAYPDTVDALLHYYPFPHLRLADMPALEEAVATIKPDLVIFDALADVLGASELEENDNGDVTKWMSSMAVPLSRTYGATVLLLDHATKDSQNASYSRGAGAKKSKVDFSWYCEKSGDFDRTTVGRLKLVRTKNRLGVLPPEVEYLAGPVGGAEMAIVPLVTVPSVVEQQSIELSPLDVQVFEAVAGGFQTSTLVAAKTGIDQRRVKDVLSDLAGRGLLVLTGERRGARWHVAK